MQGHFSPDQWQNGETTSFSYFASHPTTTSFWKPEGVNFKKMDM
jgi:hypothetical protein